MVLLCLLALLPGRSLIAGSSESPYKLPYPAGTIYRVSQGNFDDPALQKCTFCSHKDPGDPRPKYAFDFDSTFDGQAVVVSRSGKVLSLQDKFDAGGRSADPNQVNYVLIDHEDGTSALYLHLKKGSIVVKEGEKVSQGQKIGEADSSGYVTGAHLHFQVQITPPEVRYDPSRGYNRGWYTQSRRISFSDADVLAKEPDGSPKTGKSYRSDNSAPPTTTPSPRPTLTSMPTPTPVSVPPSPAATPIPQPSFGQSPRCAQFPPGELASAYSWNFGLRVADLDDPSRNIFRQPDFLFYPGEIVKIGIINESAPLPTGPDREVFWFITVKVIDPEGVESYYLMSTVYPRSSRYAFYPRDLYAPGQPMWPGARELYPGVYTVVWFAEEFRPKEGGKNPVKGPDVIFCRGFTVTGG